MGFGAKYMNEGKKNVHAFAFRWLLLIDTHYDVLLVSGSILFGILFMVSALYLIRRVWRSAVGRALKALTLVGGIVLFMLGLVSLVTPDASDWQKMISMGSVLVISGLGLILAEIFRESSQGKETEA